MGTNIPHDPESYKIAVLGMLVFFDVFLLIMGHTWDPVPNMQTIVNCRMLYVILLVAFTLVAYITWDPYMRVPYIGTVV